MVDDPFIPCQRLDSRDLPEGQGFEGWRQVTEPVFDVQPADPEEPFSVNYRAYHLGDILVGVGQFDATHFSRGRQKIRSDGLDHIMLQLYTAGGYKGDLGERSVVVKAGEIVTLDMTRELRTLSLASENITVLIPRDAIQGRVLPHGHHAPGEEGEMIGGLLADHLRSLMARLETVRQSAAGHVAEATIALYRAALAPTPDALEAASEPVRDALLLRARRLIEARLVGNDVGADALAGALHISRSTLYRLFEPFGGVAAYVLERRLARARAALRDPANIRRVGEISDACGFSDPSHFSRVFRRRFGMTPADMRRESLAVAAHRQEPYIGANLGPWIQRLG